MAKLNHINVKNLSYKEVDARQRNGSIHQLLRVII